MKITKVVFLLILLALMEGCAVTRAHKDANDDIILEPAKRVHMDEAVSSCLSSKLGPGQVLSIRVAGGDFMDETGKYTVSGTDGGGGRVAPNNIGYYFQNAIVQSHVVIPVNILNTSNLGTVLAFNGRMASDVTDVDYVISGRILATEVQDSNGMRLGADGFAAHYMEAQLHYVAVVILTDVRKNPRTGEVMNVDVGSATLQVDVPVSELGAHVARFFGSTYAEADISQVLRAGSQSALMRIANKGTAMLLPIVAPDKIPHDCYTHDLENGLLAKNTMPPPTHVQSQPVTAAAPAPQEPAAPQKAPDSSAFDEKLNQMHKERMRK